MHPWCSEAWSRVKAAIRLFLAAYEFLDGTAEELHMLEKKLLEQAEDEGYIKLAGNDFPLPTAPTDKSFSNTASNTDNLNSSQLQTLN